MNLSPAVESILHTYDSLELSDIAEGKFDVTGTLEFFDKYEDDIQTYLSNTHDMSGETSELARTYIELIAKEYIEQMSDEGGEDLDCYDELDDDEEDEEEDD